VDASSRAPGDAALVLAASALVVGHERPVSAPIDFRLHRGERLGVSGPNGAGKSTLLGAILGRARIHAGTLEVRAGPLASHPQAEIRLPQMPWTGRELLALLDASLAGAPPALAAVLDVRVDRLSGGQRQLLWVWAVLAGPGALLLLDEPSSALDGNAGDALARAVLALGTDKSALVVSHDRAFLERCCTRVLDLEPQAVR